MPAAEEDFIYKKKEKVIFHHFENNEMNWKMKSTNESDEIKKNGLRRQQYDIFKNFMSVKKFRVQNSSLKKMWKKVHTIYFLKKYKSFEADS